MAKLREEMKPYAEDLCKALLAVEGLDGAIRSVIEVCAFMHGRIDGGNGGDSLTSFVADQLPKSNLVCFRSIVYVAFQAFGVEKKKLEELETLAGKPGEPGSATPDEYLARLGRNDAVSEGAVPAGAAVFFTSPAPATFGHVAVCVGKDTVMSCNTPSGGWPQVVKQEPDTDLAKLALQRAVLAPLPLITALCGKDYKVSWSKKPFWTYFLVS